MQDCGGEEKRFRLVFTTKIDEPWNGPEFRCLCRTHFRSKHKFFFESLNIKLVATVIGESVFVSCVFVWVIKSSRCNILNSYLFIINETNTHKTNTDSNYDYKFNV